MANNESLPYPERKSDYSIGFEYSLNDNFNIGISYEKGSYTLKILYKNNPKNLLRNMITKAETNEDDTKYSKLIKNLEENGIGVNKISETSSFLGLELTQFIHPDLRIVEEIIKQASRDAGINKDIKKDLKIADLTAVSEIDRDFENKASTIYERETKSRIDYSTKIRFHHF